MIVDCERTAEVHVAVDAAYARCTAAPPPAVRASPPSLGRPAYTLWADAHDEERGRFRPAALLDASELLGALVRARGPGVRVLDLGCGDGAFLVDAHDRLGLPWAQLLGVSAEDERGRRAGGRAPALPDCSFTLANIETLAAPPGGGAPFDLVVSFSTFWHLADPLGSLQRAHDSLAAPAGLLLVHGLPLSHLAPPGSGCGDGPAADLALAARVQRELRAAGERVRLVVQHESTEPRWIRRLCVTWLQRKRGGAVAPGLEGGAGAVGAAAAGRVLPLRYAGGLVRAHDGERAAYLPAASASPAVAGPARTDDSLGCAGPGQEPAPPAGNVFLLDLPPGDALLSTAGVRGAGMAALREQRTAALFEVCGLPLPESESLS